MTPSVEPEDFVGCSVVEVGERQAWPFLTIYDGATDREARLYLDCPYTVAGVYATPDGDIGPLLQVNMRAIVAIDHRGAALTLRFDDGTELAVSGEATATTTGDVWWTGPWRKA